MKKFKGQAKLKSYLDFQYTSTSAELEDEAHPLRHKPVGEVWSCFFTSYNTYSYSVLEVCKQCEWTDLLEPDRSKLTDVAQAFIEQYFMCMKGIGIVYCRNNGGNTIERFIRYNTITNILKDL